MPVKANEIKFSILILSIPERISSMTEIVRQLQEQANATCRGKSVEILVLLDNRSKSISEKRNDLLHMARGKYIAFLDDDDAISEDYMIKIIDTIEQNDVDCISFNQWCSINGEPMNVEFGMGNPTERLWRDKNGGLGDIKRPPFHMCLWRREIAQSEVFRPVYGSDGQSIEDSDWLERLYPKIQSEYHIPAALHGYIYNSETTTSLVPRDEQ